MYLVFKFKESPMERQTVNAKILAQEYTKLSNLQKIAVSNMESAFCMIDADAYVMSPSASLDKIFNYMVPRVDRDNIRMLFSYMDDWGLLDDSNWSKIYSYLEDK